MTTRDTRLWLPLQLTDLLFYYMFSTASAQSWLARTGRTGGA